MKYKFVIRAISFLCLSFLIYSFNYSDKSKEKLTSETEPPNIIVIFADDLGYGDLGVFGHPSIKTPNIDRMAMEGKRWTNFYVGASVCTPSRAALLTGRLPVRSGTDSKDGPRVFFPNSAGGLPPGEITIAEVLKEKGYKTAAVGKWHLGHLPQFLPTEQGFDKYFGIPYSNDMKPVVLMRGNEIIEDSVAQNTITKRYTEEAKQFISENKENPFFLYLAHTMPHRPLFASDEFLDTSKRGLYGDVVEELDWSVGEILKTLKEKGLDKNTLVVFTSDNGPWTVLNQNGGSAGPLFGAKNTEYEGGMRVPAIFWWPGQIEPGVVTEIGSTLDFLPTFGKMADASLAGDRDYDGYDISKALLENQPSPRKEMFYYHATDLIAARKGEYKLYFYENNPEGYPPRLNKLDTLQLFNVQVDPSERFNLVEKEPGKAEEIKEMVQKHKEGMEFGEDQLVKKTEWLKVSDK